MGVEFALKTLLIFIIVSSMTIGYIAYSTHSYMKDSKNIVCIKTFQYKDVNVCESDSFSDGTNPASVFFDGAVNPNKIDTIYIKPMMFLQEQTLKHEYCHMLQIREKRNADELECYIKMLL